MKPIILLIFASTLQAQVPPQQPVFVNGSGLNDLSSSGVVNNGAGNHIFQINITATGTPDHFEWNEDGGSYSGAISITGSPQTLAGGVSIKFGATTGHTLSTSTDNFWTVSVVVSGTVSPMTSIQPGPGAIFRNGQAKLRDFINLMDYGAKCDGVTNDSAAVQAANDALPSFGYSSYGQLHTGAIQVPDVAFGGGCMLGPPFPVISPRVTFWSPGGTAVFGALPDSAPKGGGSTTPANAVLTVTGATNANPIVITTSTNPVSIGFVDGDTVVCQGIGGNQGANSYPNYGPWTITSVSSTGFTLMNSTGTAAYISGGTCVKGTEQFMLTILNPNGSGSPNGNFFVGLNGVSLLVNSTGNEFLSGLFCNCSIGTTLTNVYITFGYRGIVTPAVGADSINLIHPTFVAAGTAAGMNGPDPIALDLQPSTGTNSIFISNMKIQGSGFFTTTTPAVVIGAQVTNTHIHTLNTEATNWVGYIGNNVEDISVDDITATDATCSSFSDCPYFFLVNSGQGFGESGVVSRESIKRTSAG